MPIIKTQYGGEWWYPQSVIDAINAAPIKLDNEGRPTTLLGRPIVYVDDLPQVPVDLFVKKSNERK